MSKSLEVSPNGYIICDACGTEAWVPINERMLSCDCNDVNVLKSNPSQPLSTSARRLMLRVIGMTDQERKTAMQNIVIALLADEKESQPC